LGKFTDYPLSVTMRVDQWLMLAGWLDAQTGQNMVAGMVAAAIKAAMEA
jgi:hypothetical protein